jgi:cytochrome oxidase assembly protein ShyY1
MQKRFAFAATLGLVLIALVVIVNAAAWAVRRLDEQLTG